jgi:hypothetical protein
MSGAMMVSTGTFLYKASGPTPFDFYNPPQLVSASFNGTSQYLSASNAAFTFAGDFTVEGWYRPTSVSSLRTLFTIGAPTAAAGALVVYSSSGTLQAQPYGGANTTFSGATMSINTWYHVALVRSGSTIKLYFNGTANATTITNSSSIGNGAVTIGFLSGGYGYFAGQISNFRAAASAVYTADFTVPTRPLSLTGSVFYASLGVLPLVDYSTNAITVTNTGTVVLADQTPFAATWTDSISSIVATVAVKPNATSTANPTYDARYGGGLKIEQISQTYVDVPTTYSGASGFTISMAANIPAAQGSHYVAIFDGSVPDRIGQYINSRQWVGDGLEVGGQAAWGASSSTTDPAMATLAWWDFVYNGRFVSVYKNGSLVTGFNNYDMGAGNQNQGWKNPLRFCGDDSISSNNTMWPGTVWRIKCQSGALDSTAITAQFTAVRGTYGL